MAKPTANAIKTNIQAQDAAVFDQADERPAGLDLFETDLANAIAAAWADVEDGFVIASVPVVGGSSPPGGPLSGGTATLAPGKLTNAKSFTAIAGKFSTSFPDGATEVLLALVDAVAQGIGQKFALWTPGYSASLTAVGGTCAWIAPTPANPAGSPGAWSGGSIRGIADRRFQTAGRHSGISAAGPARERKSLNRSAAPCAGRTGWIGRSRRNPCAGAA